MSATSTPHAMLASARRVVVKIGSSLIVDPDSGAPRAEWLASLATDISRWRDAGRQVLVVSSGAVALGRRALGLSKSPALEEKQAAAAIGQTLLMGAWGHAFAPFGILAAQALLTLDDTETRRRWLNARATLETLLSFGAVPVINENDTVATAEIRYGDNDRLAARVSQMVAADLLLLLSDVDGLYTADPRKFPDACHVPEIRALTPEIEAMAGAPDAKGMGSGGMRTKIEAARIAWGAGCATAIFRGEAFNPLKGLESGAPASFFLPPETPHGARRQWLKGGLNPLGVLVVDEGAARALRGGASLLAVGIIGVEGSFGRGDAVAVRDSAGTLVGKGISAWSADHCRAIMGRKSDEVERVLGYRGRPAIIHRDDLALAD